MWRVPLDIGGWRDEARRDELSEEECRRADRFRFDVDRRRFVNRRAALRAIIGAYLGTAGLAVAFAEGTHGKPCLDARNHGMALRFNPSHSHELALVAVSATREVGVDVEWCRPLSDIAGVMARCFTARERLALGAVPEIARLKAFFGAWTAKEAYVKACGDGMTRDLDRVEVTIAADEQLRLLGVLDRPGDEGRWTLHRLDSGDGYVAALAVEGRGQQIQTWQWQWP